LPAPGTPEFAERAKDMREVFTDWDEKSDLAFVSPSAPAVLARMLIESAQAAPAGRLAGSRIFVALPPAMAEGVCAALDRTGATVIVFDPAVPIPQRPEALREFGITPDQAGTESARAEADARRFQAEAVRLDALAPPEPKRSKQQAEALEVMADRLEQQADKVEAAARRKTK
jgi:hypothetical protein